jgi:phosphoserine phosphatase
VNQCLALQGLTLSEFSSSLFYSDSFNDLPLLAAVTDPIAVNPDQRLRDHAVTAGWQVLELFDRTATTDD